MSRCGGEFEDLWKSKVGAGFDLQSCDGANGDKAELEAWETLIEGEVEDSFCRPDGALDEVQRAIDRARTPQLVFELESEISRSENSQTESKHEPGIQATSKTVNFNLLFEEETMADIFHGGLEASPETIKSPRMRVKHDRLKAADKEARQVTLVEL